MAKSIAGEFGGDSPSDLGSTAVASMRIS